MTSPKATLNTSFHIQYELSYQELERLPGGGNKNPYITISQTLIWIVMG